MGFFFLSAKRRNSWSGTNMWSSSPKPISRVFPISRCFFSKFQVVPQWRQPAGRDEEKLVIWDYHVIFISKPISRVFLFSPISQSVSPDFTIFFQILGGAPMASASRSRWGETRDLGLSCDLHLQTRRKVFSVRFRLGPTIPHLLSQIRHGNIPYRRHLEPRVPSIFPGDTRPRIPPDFCLRPKAYEKARRSVDETTTSLSVHHAYQVFKFFLC